MELYEIHLNLMERWTVKIMPLSSVQLINETYKILLKNHIFSYYLIYGRYIFWKVDKN